MACCTDGCYCVKANSYTNAGCSGGRISGGTAFANYGTDSPCVDISTAASINGNNDGCGSSNCDIHWYTSITSCDNDPTGAGGDISYSKAINGGECIAKPTGATYMRTVCN